MLQTLLKTLHNEYIAVAQFAHVAQTTVSWSVLECHSTMNYLQHFVHGAT